MKMTTWATSYITALLLPVVAWAGDTPACPELSTLQKAAGYIDGLNFLKILGICLVAGGVLFISSGIIASILAIQRLFEVIIWSVSIVLMASGFFIPQEYAHWIQWTTVIGSIIFPGAITYSATLRSWAPNNLRFSLTLMVIWGILAVVYGSSFIGYLAVGAALSALGFSIIVEPFCYTFGFKREDDVVNGTMSGLIMSAVYTIAHMTDSIYPWAKVFEPGALWLGSFVGSIGLLILSSKWYRSNSDHYFFTNTISVVVFFVAILVGSVFGIKEITTIYTAFAILYVASKIIEVETTHMITFGIKLLVAGGLLAYVWNWMQIHQEFVSKFLIL